MNSREFIRILRSSLITNRQISKITINIETPYGSKIHNELILENKLS